MQTIELPEPSTEGPVGVERAIATRASRRSFSDESVSLDAVAQLLWGVQGRTHERDGVDMRAAPSAGATYPLVADLEITEGGCTDLDPGLYRYDPDRHILKHRLDAPVHDELTAAALDQPVVADAPAVLALSADYVAPRADTPSTASDTFTWKAATLPRTSTCSVRRKH